MFPKASESSKSSKLRRFDDFMGKFNNILDQIVFKNSKLWSSIFPKKYKVLLLREFVQVAVCKNIPFSFENIHIFGDIQRICNLRRIFELTKILCVHLRSIFRNQRIFIFVFGPFSIFVATLYINLELEHFQYHHHHFHVSACYFSYNAQKIDFWWVKFAFGDKNQKYFRYNCCK